jgi:hypothetical protein
MRTPIEDLQLYFGWLVFVDKVSLIRIVLKYCFGCRIFGRISSFVSDVNLFISKQFAAAGMLRIESSQLNRSLAKIASTYNQ